MAAGGLPGPSRDGAARRLTAGARPSGRVSPDRGTRRHRIGACPVPSGVTVTSHLLRPAALVALAVALAWTAPVGADDSFVPEHVRAAAAGMPAHTTR